MKITKYWEKITLKAITETGECSNTTQRLIPNRCVLKKFMSKIFGGGGVAPGTPPLNTALLFLVADWSGCVKGSNTSDTTARAPQPALSDYRGPNETTKVSGPLCRHDEACVANDSSLDIVPRNEVSQMNIASGGRTTAILLYHQQIQSAGRHWWKSSYVTWIRTTTSDVDYCFPRGEV